MQTIALLESEKRGGKAGAGSAASVALHLAVVALAIAATSHAGRDFAQDRTIFVPLPRFQPTVNIVKRSAPPARRTIAGARPAVPVIQIAVPSVIPTGIPRPSAALTNPSVIGVAPSPAYGSRQGTDSVSDVEAGDSALEAYDVDVPAAVLSGQRGPLYPERLRAMGVDGIVIARFVVEKNGRVESEPTIVSSTADDFAAAVRRFLSTTRYRPAMYRGQPVRQLAQQEFRFTVGR